MKKYLFISVKEEYTNRILEGTKEIELRKSRPNVSPGDYVIIYCTSPVKAIVGIAQVQEIVTHSPLRMWKLYSKKLGIEKRDYEAYYKDSERAIGIVLSDVKKLSYSICLSLIREQLPSFTPPQTYKYFINFTPQENDNSFKLIPI
jgi:predicted transcriptional regulator